MKIYNSLTRKKEELTSKNGCVRMYSCGPTVYYYPHIGNMRAYVFMDSLRRAIKFNGYGIKGVMNITDVGHLTSDEDDGDDKMEVASKRENKSPYEIASFYTSVFMDNLKKLNIDMPEHITKATEYVDKMISFIKKLEAKGYTYIIDDGVYFDIQKFKGYGELSGKDLEKVGVARIEKNSNKRHAFDFALWKFVSDNHIMKWDSPWGVGCPGWHIECSAMSNDILGDTIDVHTGGIDHKPVHHENEIAQNDCALGHKVVKAWMHCEFLQIDGGKMSKSLNNLYTIDQLIEKGYSPMDFKYFCLNTHYSKKINFTFDALNSAKIALKNLGKLLLAHKNSLIKTPKNILEDYAVQFKNAISDDLNTPKALGILWTMLKEGKSSDIYSLAINFDKALGLKLEELALISQQEKSVPENVIRLAEERFEARKNKNFALSDQLRVQINNLGYIISDTKDGFTLTEDK